MLNPNCPVCNKNEEIITIDKLYFGILENDQSVVNRLNNLSITKNQFIKKLRPPGLEKQPFWQIISPDILVSIFLFIFLFLSIFNLLEGKQSGLQFSVITIVLFSIFLFFRKKINIAFQKQKITREKIVNKTARKIEIWSSLWICLADNTIFNTDQTINLPIDKFQNFLSSDELK